MLNGLVPDYHPWYMGTMKTTTEIQPAIRATAGAKPARKDQRSAVTNGKRLFVVRPGDTAWSRRFRDILASILCDLGGYENGLDAACAPGNHPLHCLRALGGRGRQRRRDRYRALRRDRRSARQ